MSELKGDDHLIKNLRRVARNVNKIVRFMLICLLIFFLFIMTSQNWISNMVLSLFIIVMSNFIS